MLTVRDLIQCDTQSSPDGIHWEPSLPTVLWWRIRLKDAIAVLRGDAVAVRQTTKADLATGQEEA